MSERMYQEALKKQKKQREEEARSDLLESRRSSRDHGNGTTTPRVGSNGHYTSSPRAQRRPSSPNRARSTPVARPKEDFRYSDGGSSPSRKFRLNKRNTPESFHDSQSVSRSSSPILASPSSTAARGAAKKLTLKERRASTTSSNSVTRGSTSRAPHSLPHNHSGPARRNSHAHHPSSPRVTPSSAGGSRARKQPIVRGLSLDVTQKNSIRRGSDDTASSTNSGMLPPSPISSGRKRMSQTTAAMPSSLDELMLRSPSIDSDDPQSPGQILGFMAAEHSPPRPSKRDYVAVTPIKLGKAPKRGILKSGGGGAADRSTGRVDFSDVSVLEFPKVVIEDEDGDVELTIDWLENPADVMSPKTRRINAYEDQRVKEGRIIAKNFKSREQDEIRQLAEEGRALLWKIGEHCFLEEDEQRDSSVDLDDEDDCDPTRDSDYEELRDFLADINPHLLQDVPSIAKLGVVVPSDFSLLRVTVNDLIQAGIKLLSARQIIAKSGGNNAVSATRFALHGPATRDSQLKKLGLALGRKLTSKD